MHIYNKELAGEEGGVQQKNILITQGLGVGRVQKIFCVWYPDFFIINLSYKVKNIFNLKFQKSLILVS